MPNSRYEAYLLNSIRLLSTYLLNELKNTFTSNCIVLISVYLVSTTEYIIYIKIDSNTQNDIQAYNRTSLVISFPNIIWTATLSSNDIFRTLIHLSKTTAATLLTISLLFHGLYIRSNISLKLHEVFDITKATCIL